MLHVDLAAGTVNGVPLLGRTPAAIRSALGPPDYVERYPRRVDLGYGSRTTPRVEVIVDGTAWALQFADPGDTDARLGPLLARPPRALQREIAATYGAVFRLVRSYRCDPKGCYGEFASRDGRRRLLFGVSRRHRYVNLRLRLQ